MILGDFGDVSVSADVNLDSGGNPAPAPWTADALTHFMLVNESAAMQSQNINDLVAALKRAAFALGYQATSDTNKIVGIPITSTNVARAYAQMSDPLGYLKGSMNVVNNVYPLIVSTLTSVAHGLRGIAVAKPTPKAPAPPPVQTFTRAAAVAPTGVPSWVWIAGGAVVLGAVGYYVVKRKKAA